MFTLKERSVSPVVVSAIVTALFVAVVSLTVPGCSGEGPEPEEEVVYGLGEEVMPESDEEIEVEYKIVSAEAAAKRTLCLGALIMRGEFEVLVSSHETAEGEAKEALMEAHKELSAKFNQWLKKEGLWKELSTNERKLMGKPLGSWTERDKIDASWRQEALCVVAWAIGVVDKIPAYDQQTDQQSVISTLQLLGPVKEFIAKAKLRPEAEIAEARDIAELWLWRARTTRIQKEPDKYPPPEDMTYEQIIAMTAQFAEEEGLFKAIKKDFPAMGKPYSKLTEEEFSIMNSIAKERLYGLNWLCGYSDDWDEVPTDT